MSEKSIEETEEQKTEALNKAMAELDDLEKSAAEDAKDEIDELEKALIGELGESLTKSGDSDKDDTPTAAEEKAAEPVPNDGEADDACQKSADADYDDELVKASEAFDDLRKSVFDMTAGIVEEITALKKSLAAQLNLNIKMATVLGSLYKSRQADADRIEKSMADLSSQPVIPNKAAFGIGSTDPAEALTKSISEVADLLTVAVQNKQVDARYLSIFGTHKDVSRLPADVQKIIGL